MAQTANTPTTAPQTQETTPEGITITVAPGQQVEYDFPENPEDQGGKPDDRSDTVVIEVGQKVKHAGAWKATGVSGPYEVVDISTDEIHLRAANAKRTAYWDSKHTAFALGLQDGLHGVF